MLPTILEIRDRDGENLSIVILILGASHEAWVCI